MHSAVPPSPLTRHGPRTGIHGYFSDIIRRRPFIFWFNGQDERSGHGHMASHSPLERHHHRDLPRHWVTLPAPVRRTALSDPLLSGLFPTHVGYFPRAGRHGVSRDRAIESTVFNYCV